MSIPAIKARRHRPRARRRAAPGLADSRRDPAARRRPRPTRIGVARPTNNAGGLEGGVTNGEDLRVTGYMKPIATLMKPLRSVDLDDDGARARRPSSAATSAPCRRRPSSAKPWSPSCSPTRSLEKFGGDSIDELRRELARRSQRRGIAAPASRPAPDVIRPDPQVRRPGAARAGRAPVDAFTPDIDRLDRRHDRDDVRGARASAWRRRRSACRCASSSSTSRSAATRRAASS